MPSAVPPRGGQGKRIGIAVSADLSDDAHLQAVDLAALAAGKGLRPTWLQLDLQRVPEAGRDPLLAASLDEYAANRNALARQRGRRYGFPVLHALGDRLSFCADADDAPGGPDIGLAFIEHVDIGAPDLARAAGWPLIVAGSSWAGRVLRDRGLAQVVVCPAGVDTARFRPAPRSAQREGRFVVFSGGELAFSKGQDIVIEAFRIFRQRHPDAMLACHWRRPAATHGPALPLLRWLARQRIAPEDVIDLGHLHDGQLPDALHACDMAVFPGRCEGSVPRFAMRAMACGLPTVLAGNTAHLDLAGDHAYVLTEQRDVAALTADAGRQGWGECAVEELLETMERVHSRRAEAARKGRAAAVYMQRWSRERQFDRLLASIHRAVAGRPVEPSAVAQDYAWGLGLHRGGRLAEARQVYDDILRREPAHTGARMDRGHARRDLGDLAGSKADFAAVLASHADHPHALQCLGNLLRHDGDLQQASDCLRRAVRGAGTASMHWDLAFTLLMMGRYAEAWPHFERRHEALGLRTAHAAKPRWDGRPVVGTLLVLDEQGLGDTLQFLRFLPRIPAADAGRVVFAGKPATLPVVRRWLPEADVYDWDRPLPRFDAWVPLMSLPERLGVARPEDLPPPSADRLVEPGRVARWRERVRGSDDRPVVALCWRGNPDFPGDALRSPGLAPLRHLLRVEGLRFVSLQVGAGRQEIAELGLAEHVADIGGALEQAGAQVLDTLAALQSCDFVVSSCTSVAHMAGLLALPGRVLLSSRPDWRWMTRRTDTPWYPSLRLIRQRTPGDWSAVGVEAAAQLAAWRDRPHRERSEN